MTMKSILLNQIEARGEARGRAEATHSLMESLHCTKEKAIELLKIPAELQPEVLEQL